MMLMIFWTVATWILTVILIHIIGFNGFALGLLILAFPIVIVIRLAKRYAVFSFTKQATWPFAAALVQAGWYFVARGEAPYHIPWLVFVASVGVILYMAVVWMIQGKRIMDIIHISRS
jgi:O-antigen/teichoic acid export membrane protein